MSEQVPNTPLTSEGLKNQAFLERIRDMTLFYENQDADRRVVITQLGLEKNALEQEKDHAVARAEEAEQRAASLHSELEALKEKTSKKPATKSK